MTVEQEFEKLVPDWMGQYNKKCNGQSMDPEYNLDLRFYSCCFVGSIRQKLGLNKFYSLSDKEKCMDCVLIANTFLVVDNPLSFIQSLEYFKKHLEGDHKVKLEAVNS